MTTNYAEKKCTPCEGGVPPLGDAALDEALLSLEGWDAREARSRIHKHYRFRDFVEAMRFVNAMAAVAEAEGHHPDFTVHWNTVDVELWTHAIGGLSENDLIMAAKLDRLPEARDARSEPRH